MLLIAVASAAAIILAARGALDNHRATIEVMHGIGATDRQVARLFVRQIAIDALLGGVAGAAAAGLIIALIIGGASTATMLAGTPPLALGRRPAARAAAVRRRAAGDAGCQGGVAQGIARALMIARLLSFLAILYVLGFALFAVTLGEPAPKDAPKADAIVVITGGKGRIEHAAACSTKARASGC